jgi:hypothetical protein
VILLEGLEGMSYQDAAGILKIPVGTARSRLFHGRDILRKVLDMEKRRSSAALPILVAAALSQWIYLTKPVGTSLPGNCKRKLSCVPSHFGFRASPFPSSSGLTCFMWSINDGHRQTQIARQPKGS